MYYVYTQSFISCSTSHILPWLKCFLSFDHAYLIFILECFGYCDKTSERNNLKEEKFYFGWWSLGPVSHGVRQKLCWGAHGEEVAHLMAARKQRQKEEGSRDKIHLSKACFPWPSSPNQIPAPNIHLAMNSWIDLSKAHLWQPSLYHISLWGDNFRLKPYYLSSFSHSSNSISQSHNNFDMVFLPVWLLLLFAPSVSDGYLLMAMPLELQSQV
jgi:hypothetical protein